jgi:hypothetical protein
MAAGGVYGMHPGEPQGTDNIPAWLTKNEYVMPADKTKRYFHELEAMRAGRYHDGGVAHLQHGGFPPQEQEDMRQAENARKQTFGYRFSQLAPQAAAFGGVSGLTNAAIASAPPQVQIALAAFQSIEGGLKIFTTALNLAGDSTKTNAQKMQGLAESMPIIGGLAKVLKDLSLAAAGVPDTIKRANQSFQLFSAQAGVTQQYQGQRDESRFAATAGGYRANTLNAFAGGPLMMGPTARTRIQDAIAYQEQLMRGQAQEDVRMAAAEASATQQGANLARIGARATGVDMARAGREADLAQHGLDAMRRRQERQGWQESLTNPLEGRVHESFRTAEAANLTAVIARERHEQAIARARQASMQATQAEAQHRQALINLAQRDLEIARNREQRREEGIARLGGMHPVQAGVAINIARRIQQQGSTVGFSEAELDIGSQVLPGMVGRFRAQRGERLLQQSGLLRTPEGAAEFGGRGTRSQIQGEVNTAAEQVREMTRQNVATLATDMAGIMSEFSTQLAEVIRVAIRDAVRAVRESQQYQNAMNNH